MKNFAFLLLITLFTFASCKKDTPTKSEESPANQTEMAVGDNTKFGMDASSNPQGLAVGSQAPNVKLTLADGSVIALEDLYKKQPVVLFFYRGYWCPVCNKHLSALAKQAQDIESKGVKLLAITPETYENVTKTKDQTGAKFTIISDTDDSILNAFDVAYKVTDDYQNKIQEHLKASIANTNANGQAVLPVPATYIIDSNGKIVYRQFNPDYQERASIDDIIANLPK